MRHSLLLALLLACLASVLLFHGLGDASFHDEDEALYAAVSSEMIETGDWLTPRYWQEPFLHKPPLGYWLIGTSMSFRTEHPEFAARAPSATAALLLILLVFYEAKRLGGPLAGLAAGLLLLLNHHVLFEHAARSAALDALVMLFSFAALSWGLRSGSSRAALIGSVVALACLAMLKAPLIVFPAIPVSIVLWRQGRPRLWRYWRWAGGALLLLVLPWHLAMLVLHGRDFVETYFIYEILGRSGATASTFSPPRWVHVHAFWSSFLPASPFVALALFAALIPWPRLEGEFPAPARSFLRAHAGFVLLLFATLSLVVAKWPWYGLPAYPSLALIAGVLAARMIAGGRMPQLALILAAAGGIRAFFCVPNPAYAPAARPSFLWPSHDEFYHLPSSLPGSWTLLAGGLFALLFVSALLTLRSSKRIQAALLLTAACALASFVTLDLLRVPLRFQHPAASLGEALAAENYAQVFLSSFRHQQRYQQRMAPIESFYLGRLTGTKIVDLDRPGPRAEAPATEEHCALVSGSEEPLAAVGWPAERCDPWSYHPRAPRARRGVE